MNRHQKELRLAELTVSRDILNQQIEAIRRELASDGLQIWKDRADQTEEPRCHRCFGTKTSPNSVYIADHTVFSVRTICSEAFHTTNQ